MSKELDAIFMLSVLAAEKAAEKGEASWHSKLNSLRCVDVE